MQSELPSGYRVPSSAHFPAKPTPGAQLDSLSGMPATLKFDNQRRINLSNNINFLNHMLQEKLPPKVMMSDSELKKKADFIQSTISEFAAYSNSSAPNEEAGEKSQRKHLQKQFENLKSNLDKSKVFTFTVIKKGESTETKVGYHAPSWGSKTLYSITRIASGIGAATLGLVGIGLFPITVPGLIMIASSFSGSDVREIAMPETAEEEMKAKKWAEQSQKKMTAGCILAAPFVGCKLLLDVAFGEA